MSISVFEIFKVGVGPSSSHTMGPMKAAARFVTELEHEGQLINVTHVSVELYGSLALTGKGHCTDTAVLLGLEGIEPESLDPDEGSKCVSRIRTQGELMLASKHLIKFDEALDLLFLKDQYLPQHPNGMRLTAFSKKDTKIRSDDYFSTGGGFIVRHDEINQVIGEELRDIPFPFKSASQLLQIANEHSLSITDLVLANELVSIDKDEIQLRLRELWSVMRACVARGFSQRGVLPGVLAVSRRAPRMHDMLQTQGYQSPTLFMDWVTAWALSVNEENAAGGKVVTAPTNGAAGIVPAVLHYYDMFVTPVDDITLQRFFLTSGVVGSLYKMNASISGAEMGCQGEVGVACSMAAAGLVAAMGGSNMQIENAAEIGMEHNLGLTCDPIAGLVQIPCIERNAMGAVKAINAAQLAMRGDGSHKVSLDQVIETMRQTGMDMNSVYKETSKGGLAVNVTEC